MKLTIHDVFVDIGHGIGNTLFQAAYTTGCSVRGIEVMKGRNFVAQRFLIALDEIRHVQATRDGTVSSSVAWCAHPWLLRACC